MHYINMYTFIYNSFKATVYLIKNLLSFHAIKVLFFFLFLKVYFMQHDIVFHLFLNKVCVIEIYLTLIQITKLGRIFADLN